VLRAPDSADGIGKMLEPYWPRLFDTFAYYSHPLQVSTIKTGPFFLSLSGWLKFAKDCELDLDAGELAFIFETISDQHELAVLVARNSQVDDASRRPTPEVAKAGALGMPGFVEALLTVALKLNPPDEEPLTSAHVLKAARQLVTGSVLPKASRTEVLTFRAAMLGTVPLLHAFDVLSEQLHQVHSNYANYDGTVDAEELLDMCKDSGLLYSNLTEEQVLTAFASSLPVAIDQPRTLRSDGSFQECVLRLGIAYSEDGEASGEPMAPHTVDIRNPRGRLAQKDEKELLKRLAIMAHTLSDSVLEA